MLKKKHVLFHTDAEVEQAQGMLEAQTVKASPMPDHPLESLKDTFSLDQRAFRGKVEAGTFALTRRRRGRSVRIQVEGTLQPKKSGGTEIKASMSAPKTLLAGLVGGMAAAGLMGAGVALSDIPLWAPLVLLLGEGLAVGLGAWMYERETSRTFSALRDAIPEHPPQVVAPIAEPTDDGAVPRPERTRQGE